MIARGLGGRIAVIDTERGSASLYSDLVDFSTLELNPPFTPERYIEALRCAEKAGFDTVIIDSVTHEWNGSGGCLDINDELAQSKFRGNTWAAWNAVTPRHRAFIDSMLQSPCHVITTMRSKTETLQGEDKKVRKVGMKMEARDGTEYEFTVVLECSHDNHIAVASKDRTRLFPQPHIITEETGKRLADWLEAGAEPPPAIVEQLPELTVDYDPTMDDAVTIAAMICQYASDEQSLKVFDAWGKVKADKALGRAVWAEMKLHPEFGYIQTVLKG